MRKLDIFKLALTCLMIAGLLHLPGYLVAQDRNLMTIQWHPLPISDQMTIATEGAQGIREWGVKPQINISTMAVSQVGNDIVIPFIPNNIIDNAQIYVYFDNGSGVQVLHDFFALTDASNNQLLTTNVRYTSIQSNEARLIIQGCQDQMGNCTSVIVIVTVDGRPPFYQSDGY